MLRVFRDGEETTLGLGSAEEVGLGEARGRADAARRRMRSGLAPRDEKKFDTSFSFTQVMQRWLAAVGHDWSAVHRKRNDMLIRLYLTPQLGDLDINKIDRAKLLAVLAPVAEDRRESARRSLALADQIFRYAVETNLAPANPASDLLKNVVFKKQKVTHHAALSPEATRAALAKLDANPNIPATTKAALWLVATTALREGSARAITWSMLDGDVLRIPGSLMKSRKPFVTPVPPKTLARLRACSTGARATCSRRARAPRATSRRTLCGSSFANSLAKRRRRTGSERLGRT